MFCIKCGSPAKAGNFCERCFLEKEKLFEAGNFTLEVCPLCGRNKNDLERQVMEKIKSKHRITGCTIKKREVGNRIYADVSCAGFMRPLKKKVSQKTRMIIFIKEKKCENCVKLLGGYYEAALQVRGERAERILKKLKFVPADKVARIDKLKNGYDVRLVDKKTAANAVRYLKEYFDIKESYKLVGEKKGKKLYRNYYAVR